MNILHGFGCSFMHGLQKLPKDYIGEEPNRNKSVGAFLAENLGANQFSNHGVAGCSNIDIAEKVKTIKFKKNDFVFILWTGLHRVPDQWNKPTPVSAASQEALYATMAYRNTLAILKTDSYLKKRGIKFAMATAFQDYKFYDYFNPPDRIRTYWIDYHIKNNSLLDAITGKIGSTQWENFQAILVNDIGMNLPEDTFPKNDIRKHKAVADCFHPSAYGHELAGKYYAEKIKEMF